MKRHHLVNALGIAMLFVLMGSACSSSLPFLVKTPTPTPTATATLTQTPSPTLTPTATLDVAATRAAEATQAYDQEVTEAKSQLAKINVSVDSGSLIYYQSQSIPLKLNNYMQGRYYPFVDDQIVTDFIVKTDVTWETENSLLLCGLILRSDPNFEMGKQYLFEYLRLSGLPAWDIEFYNNGQFANSINGNPKVSRAIKLDNGSTNQFIMIVKGNEFDLYANNTFIGKSYDWSKQASQGYMAFYGFQDTGSSTCQFDNTWVWKFK
jgi:hypothetical protein